MDIEWPWDERKRKEREDRDREKREREQLDRIEKDERRILKEEQEIEQLEREELKLLRRAQSATLAIRNEKGEYMSNLVVGQSAEAVYTEFSLPNGGGVVVPNAGPIAFASSDGAIATVDPVSGHIVAVAAGTATITGSDAANGLNASDTVTVTGIQAQSATLVITPNNDAPNGAPGTPGTPAPASFRK